MNDLEMSVSFLWDMWFVWIPLYVNIRVRARAGYVCVCVCMCVHIYIYIHTHIYDLCLLLFCSPSTLRNEFVDFLYKILLFRSKRFRKGKRRNCFVVEILLQRIYLSITSKFIARRCKSKDKKMINYAKISMLFNWKTTKVNRYNMNNELFFLFDVLLLKLNFLYHRNISYNSCGTWFEECLNWRYSAP